MMPGHPNGGLSPSKAQWPREVMRGLFALALSAAIVVAPIRTLAILVAIFGAYLVVAGLFEAISAFAGGATDWSNVARGAFMVILGAVTVAWPGVTGLVLLLIASAWLIANGVVQIGMVIRYRRQLRGEWLLVLVAGLSVLFGVFLLLMPAAGLVAVAWVLGGYGTIEGVFRLIRAFRLRALARSPLPDSMTPETNDRQGGE